MGFEYETVHAIAEAALASVARGNDTHEAAIATLLSSGARQDVYDYTMMMVGTVRRTYDIAPPFAFVAVEILAVGLPATSEVDDVVLTILSHGLGGPDGADLDGVRQALDDARRRECMAEVLLRLAAMAAGFGELTKAFE